MTPWPKRISRRFTRAGVLDVMQSNFVLYERAMGLPPESRVLVAMLDTPEWPVVFLPSHAGAQEAVAAATREMISQLAAETTSGRLLGAR